MKLLERVNLIQFFLYDAKDVDTGPNTAFLGPNGTGKTALLDAIQVVMLAADGNRTNFNAASDGKKRARDLRDYCLGSFVPGGSSYRRTASNTYVGMVFRDTITDIPFTVGVSLRAHIDDAKAEVNGYFILPGVGLTAKQYLQTEGQRETVIPWRAFQHMVTDLCRLEANTTPQIITQSRDDFMRRLLIEHLAGPGDKPNPQAFRAAFSRSLKLNEDIVDLNETLRQHLIEPMPVRITEFRDRLNDVRDLRDMIRRLRERIERAVEIAGKYAVVQQESTSGANLSALKHVYATERLGETVDAAEAQASELAEKLELAGLERERASFQATQALGARDRAIEALTADPEYQQQAGHVSTLKQLESQLVEKVGQLRKQFQGMQEALSTACSLESMEGHRSAFEEAGAQIRDLELMLESGTTPPAVTLQQSLRAVSEAYDVVRRAAAEAEREAKEAEIKRNDASIVRERASRGLTELNGRTTALMGQLASAGIESTPVCDLATVSDPSWQAPIESWLGPHIEALLIPAEKELEAIEVYRSKAANGIYNVKMALPSRIREWHPRDDEPYAARLIRGQNHDAVRYLQGELGRTILAESSEQIRVGFKAISKEGMTSSGGGVDRKRLPGANELRLGRSDTNTMRQHAELAFQKAEAHHEQAQRAARSLVNCQQKLAPYADATGLQAGLESSFMAKAQAEAASLDLRETLASARTGALADLEERKIQADKVAKDTRDLEIHWAKEETGLKENLRQLLSQKAIFEQQLKLAVTQEQESRRHPLYNSNEVERHRKRLDEHHQDNWTAKLQGLEQALVSARGKADKNILEGWNLLANYLKDYNRQNVDIQSDDWMSCYGFILEEQRRLEEMELVEQEEKADEAYEAAVRVFRSDVAQTLLAGFDRIEEQIAGLTAILKKAPAFSNGERYEFKYRVVDEHSALYEFLNRIRTHGVEDNLFGGPGEVPEEFRLLVEGDGTSSLLGEASPLNDHRRFFSYDVEVFQHDTSLGLLSKRFIKASGGEHRTPVYLIFGAALAACYGKSKDSFGGGGIMLLDEAFEKMDAQNIRATVQFLNTLGLQLILAGPETDQGKMSSFLNIYYDMSRFGGRHVQMKKNVISDAARDLLQSDNYLLNPELLQQEISRISEEQNELG